MEPQRSALPRRPRKKGRAGQRQATRRRRRKVVDFVYEDFVKIVGPAAQGLCRIHRRL
jgi:hypothetical protein